MQANDLIADLRAEIAAWWEGKMADHRSSVIAAAAAALVSLTIELLCPYTFTTMAFVPFDFIWSSSAKQEMNARIGPLGKLDSLTQRQKGFS